MFMSTVVYLVEFIVVSLVGIMLYKLYKAWKHSRAFTAHADLFDVSKKTCDFSSNDTFRSDSLAVNKITLIDTETVAENSLLEEPVAEKALKDNKSSTILKDYIGEFFSEPQLMEMESFKAPEPTKLVSVNQSLDQSLDQIVLTSVVSDLGIEEDIIKVEPMLGGSNEKYDIKTLEAVLVEDDAIPTLKELSDLESESFITVASSNNDSEQSNKVMSDKVVMAMLDEAKLVCAS